MPDSRKMSKEQQLQTSQVPAAQYMMMSILSFMSLESVLAILSCDSPHLKNLAPQVRKQTHEELTALGFGLNTYNRQTLTSSLNGECIWQEGSSKLYEYPGIGKPLLFIPSLINKPNILDLSTQHSLLLRLSALGVKPFLLDWGAPQNTELGYTLDDYINRLVHCVQYIGKVNLAGYCMGGQLALAGAILAEQYTEKLITIATPWDFTKSYLPKNPLWWKSFESLPDPVPADFIQNMFYLSEFSNINQKFIKYGQGSFANDEFVMIENWVNDGVPMSKNVLRACLQGFVKNNILVRGQWRVNGLNINPKMIKAPVLCAIADNDKIAPKNSCMALYYRLKQSKMFTCSSGHIGMIINPKYQLAESIAGFL